MRYGEHHPLTYDTGRGEKLVWNFTGYQAFWLGLGLFLAWKVGRLVPRLPFGGIFGYLHYLPPVLLGAVFAFGRHASGPRLFDYLIFWLQFKRRPRALAYRRKEYVD